MRYLIAMIFVVLCAAPAAALQNIAACTALASSDTYVLVNDVTSNGTCFTITAHDVTLDLNGHTVTYDNAAPITVPNGSFESALAGTWDLTNAPNAERFAGSFVEPTTIHDGSYGIRFALPAANQYFESVGDVTLEPYTTYSLSMMSQNGNKGDTGLDNINGAAYATRANIVMSIEIVGTAYKATQTGPADRGMFYTHTKFTTGPSPVSGKIRISVENATASGVTGHLYVDNIRILKANSYAVDAGPGYAASRNFRVTNGAIVQGQGNGFESHAINMSESAGEGFSIDNVTFTVQGVNSKPISGYYFLNSTINNNTFNHNTTTIRSRDNYDGATIYLPYPGTGRATGSTLHHNTFNTGPQTAISIVQSNGYPKQQIYNNNITLQSRYTNDFAISASGTIIHDNTVNCGSGNNSCRGIVANGDGTQIYNNTVSVQQLPRNQEYNGCEAYGAYGMQMEYSATNIEVYGNTVTANAGQCEAHAFRANPDAVNAINNLVHDNVFTAIASGTGRATSLKLSEFGTNSANFYNNTFRTNHRWIYLDGEGPVTNPTFTSNRWETTGTLPTPFYPFEVFTWSSSHFTGTFHCNTYGTGDQTRFESSVFRETPSMGVDALSSFTTDAICSPINGTCGAASGQTFSALTTANATLCGSGTVNAFSGSGPWTWGCNGLNGGTSTASTACSATYSAAPPDATCSDGIQNQGETGVDCGGPCSACYVGQSVLSGPRVRLVKGGNRIPSVRHGQRIRMVR